MELQLIKGLFTAQEAVDVLTHMVDVKIKFHEGKITPESSEEDIKMRERRIKQLQKELSEMRLRMGGIKGRISLCSTVSTSS